MPKLIIFDFDGTIVDSMWAWDELGRVTLEEHGISPMRDYEEIIRTMSVPDFAQYLSEIYPVLGGANEIIADWHKRMVYNYCNRIPLKSGIIQFLEFLKISNYVLYLASATHYEVLTEALKHFDIEKYFDYIVTEEIVGISKRSPDIYNLCVDKAKSDKKNTIVFEDAVHAVITVKELGIRVCAIKDYSMRNHEKEIKEAADLYVEDFSDLNKLAKFVAN